jgi:hypothetical protein
MIRTILRRIAGGGGPGPVGSTNARVDVKPTIDIDTRATGMPRRVETATGIVSRLQALALRITQKPAVDVDVRATGAPRTVAVNPAIDIDARTTGSPRTVDVKDGVAVSQGVRSLRVAQNPAVDVDVRATGSPRAVEVKDGVAVSQGARTARVSQNPAVEMKQITVTLVQAKPTSTVVQEAVSSRSDWTNIANGQGSPDGSSATMVSNISAARSGRLLHSYPARLAKDALQMTKLEVRFYTAQAGTLLNNGNLVHGVRRQGRTLGATLATHTGNVDFLSSPQVFDLTTIANAVADDSGNRRGANTNNTVAAINTTPLDAGFGNCIDLIVGGDQNAFLDCGPLGSLNLAGLTAWTVECILKAPSTSTGYCVMGTWHTNSADQCWYAGKADSANGNVGIITFRNAAGTQRTVLGTTALNDGNPHRIRGVLAGGFLYLLVDGVVEGTPLNVGADVVRTPTAATAPPMTIGRVVAAATYSPASWDEVRVSNNDRGHVGYTVDAAPFATDANTLALWHMEDVTGVGRWQMLDVLQATVTSSLPSAATTITVSDDAVTMYVEASRTDAL